VVWPDEGKDCPTNVAEGLGDRGGAREGIKTAPPRDVSVAAILFLRGQLRSVFFGFGSGLGGFSHLETGGTQTVGF
jgi:hypothetical protein